MAIPDTPALQRLALTVAEPAAPLAGIRATQEIAAAGQKLGEKIQAVQNENDALWTAEQLGQARQFWQSDMIRRQQGAAEEPVGFAQGVQSDYATWQQDVLKNAPTDGARRRLQEHLSTTLAPWVSANAETFEAQRVMASREQRLDRVIQSTANGLFQNPAGLPQSLAEIEQTIAATTLPADRKALVLTQARNAFATQALKGLIEKDPDAGSAAAQSGKLFGIDLNPLLRVDPNSGAGNLASLNDQAQAEIRRRQAMALAAARADRAEARGELDGLIQNDLVSRRETGRGLDIPEDLFKRAGLPQSRIDLIKDRQRIAGELFTATTTMAMATPDEVTALMNGKPPEGTDAKGAAIVRDAALKVISERNQAIAGGEAVGWVMRHDPNVREGFDDLRTAAANNYVPDLVQSYMRRAFQRALDAQRRIGVDESQLTVIGRERAQHFVASLDPLKPLESADALAKTLASYPDFARPIVMRELNAAKLPAWMITMGEISDPAARQRLAQAAAIGPQRLTSDAQSISKDAPTAIKEQIGTAATDLVRTMYRAGGGAPGAAERMLDAANMIALHQVAQGRQPAEAVRQAVDDVWGRLRFTDTYMLPKDAPGQLERNAQDIKAKLLPQLQPLTTGDKRIDGTPEHEKMLKDVLARSYWTNDADGKSLVLRTPNGELWLTKDGAPMRMSFEQLAQDPYNMPPRPGSQPNKPLDVVRQMRRDFDAAHPELVDGKAPGPRVGPRDLTTLQPPPAPAPGTMTLPPMSPPASVAPGRPTYTTPPRPQAAPAGRDARR